MKQAWTDLENRQQILDFIDYWQKESNLPRRQLLAWLDIASSTYHDWCKRANQKNRHNGIVPKAHWLLPWERSEILDFAYKNPEEGYRRLTYLLIDANVVAASPSSVYRVLKEAGVLDRWNGQSSNKGTGFQQPSGPHEHWHTDVAYLNICGTFYYLCSIIDGYSRYVVHWEIREQMKEVDVEIILQRALEANPGVTPRLITDNGPQFVSKDLKIYLREKGLKHVRTSPYYPQSNGKIERWHKSLKSECIRKKTPLSLEDARQVVTHYVAHYNHERLHSAIGYISPADKLAGKEAAIFAARRLKLAQARERRCREYQAKAS
jgi:transposase InsO family protein